MAKTVFSTTEAARKAEVSETFAREYAHDQELPRLGTAFVWTVDDIDELTEHADAQDDLQDAIDEDDDEDDDDGADED